MRRLVVWFERLSENQVIALTIVGTLTLVVALSAAIVMNMEPVPVTERVVADKTTVTSGSGGTVVGGVVVGGGTNTRHYLVSTDGSLCHASIGLWGTTSPGDTVACKWRRG